ncbi:DNA-binding protein [Priestia megaterium]|nr:DNA-binding protein [Priestia megaterium]
MALTDELKNLIKEEVISAAEVGEILDMSRQSLAIHVKKGNLVPFKKVGNTQLFFKDEILAFQGQLDKNRALYRPYDEKYKK